MKIPNTNRHVTRRGVVKKNPKKGYAETQLYKMTEAEVVSGTSYEDEFNRLKTDLHFTSDRDEQSDLQMEVSRIYELARAEKKKSIRKR